MTKNVPRLILPTTVWVWHAAEGCCKHRDGIVCDDSVCCVCDIEDPCLLARENFEEWLPTAVVFTIQEMELPT